MATKTHSESRRLYSWWWDSHISPKNSKWLQDNLTDIDAKVKTMIKLIEEDADSFARRAEMYYKKRPELMKLVEEFYRAYRALAERYDHATGELRHAQRAMAAAFPNQLPFPFADDPQSLNSDDFGTDESKKGLKQLQEMLAALENSKPGEEKERDFKGELSLLSDENQNLKDRATKAENEIEILQKALESLHSEKEGVLHRYDETVNKLFNLERELDGARMSSRGLGEEASQAKAEVENLKEALLRLERERDNALSKLNEYREKISKLEAALYQSQKDEEGLTGRVVKAEAEAQYLEEELSSMKIENKGLMGRVVKTEADTLYLEEQLSKLKVENNAVSSEYQQCLDRVSDLEKKLSSTQEKANVLNERADRAENEVRALNKALFEASEDKEGIVRLYEHSLEKISKLENELSCARDDIRRFIGEMKLKNEKLKSLEENCAVLETSNHALKLEANNLERKISTKNEELLEKDEEIEKVRLGLQNEHTRFVQAEVTLQTLRNLHSQAQREQKGLALELKNGLKMLKEMEEKKHGLEEEIFQVKDENKILNESNLSSKVAMENLESEILALKEMKEKLEREVGLQMGQTNTLQKEIHNLNEDIVGLNTRYNGVIEQIESVGLDPENLESTIKDLLDQNLELRQLCDKERDEKQNFVEKLENMKQFVDKNASLEGSLTALSGELEKSQEKVDALRREKSYLVDEKAVILSQLQAISESMQKLLERNTFLEKSLSGANNELLSLREKANCLEELCKSLNNDKSNLLNETNTLVIQLGNVEQTLENLENKFADLEVRYAGLEKERESTLSQVVELKTCLDIEKRERASLTLSSEARLTRLEDNVQLLQEEGKSRKKEFEEELDRAVKAQFEVFVLQRFIQDMEHKNVSLLLECQKHVEASKLSDKVISELESENLEQQVESEFLLDEIEKLRVGVYQVLKVLGVGPDHGLVDKMENDIVLIDSAVENIEDLKFSLSNYKDDKDQLSIENSVLLTLLGQLNLEASEFVLEKNNLQNCLNITSEQLLVEQNEKKKIIEINSQLNSDVKLRDQLTDKLKAEIEMVSNEEREMKRAYLKLHDEYSQKLEENRSLLKTLLDLKEKKNLVEEENHSILIEALALDSRSIVFKQFGDEMVEEVKTLSNHLQTIKGQKGDLENESGKLKSELNSKEDQNLLLECWVKKLGDELDDIKDINSQLTDELSISKSSSNQKEVELLIVTEKLKSKEELNSQLCRIVEGLKKKIEGTEIMAENLEKCNLDLSQESKNQKNEIENLRELNGFLDSEVDVLKKEVEARKIREEKLSLELKEISNEFQMWEAEAETFQFDLQISTIREFFLENKVHELSCECEKIENERDSKMAEIEKMKQRVSFLESEVGCLKGQLLAYDPIIDTLRDNVISLEKKILSQQELNMPDTRKSEDVEFAIDFHEKSSNDLMENDNLLVPNGVSELQHLQNRIKEVEKVVTEEMKRRGKLKIPKTNNKLEAAMREIEDIKANCSLRFGKVNEKSPRKAKPEFFEIKNGIGSTKDIPLDNISNDSVYGISRRRFQRADDQMLELWETSEDDHSLGRIKTKSIEPVNLSRRFESVDTSMELLVEKELGVDRLEVPTNGTESTPDRNKRKVLERLSFDAQKLKNIKTTVEDLRRKMEENATKKKKAKSVDFETVKEQLEEVKDTIIQLVEVNEKLKKNVEENSYLSDKKASPELEVIVNLRRKRVADQARKESEKICRLLIEVQKIQYILLKPEDEKKTLGKIRFSKSKTSIIFKDFISGKRRNTPKRKKPCLCGCFRTTSYKEGKSISDFNHLRYE